MKEQERMEQFYNNYRGAAEFRAFLIWRKDEAGDYIAPLARMLWAGWQAAQHGQLSFDFDDPGYFGEK